MAKTFDLSVIFKVVDKMTRPIQKIGRSVEKLKRPFTNFERSSRIAFSKVDVGLRKLERRFEKVGKRIERSGFTKIGKRMKETGAILTTRLTLPMAILGGIIAKRSIDFETAWTGVRKTVNASKPEFVALKKELMDLALISPTLTTEIFRVAEVAGQIRVKAKDIPKFVKDMLELQQASNVVADEGAKIFARFAKIVKLPRNEISRLTSAVVALGNEFEVDEAEIVSIMKELVGMGTVVGLSADQIIALSATLRSAGLNAESAGSAFSMVMAKIDKSVSTSDKYLKGFAKVSGLSAEKFKKAWKDDAGTALLKFVEGLKDTEKFGLTTIEVLDKLGLDGIRMSKSLLLASESGDTYRKTMKLAAEASSLTSKRWKEGNAALHEAAIRNETAAAKLKIQQNRADQLAAAYGDNLIPIILKVVNAFTPLMNGLKKLSPLAKQTIVWVGILAGVIGPLIILFGALAVSIGFIAGAFGIAAAPAIAFVGAIVSAITAIAALAIIIFEAWEPVKQLFRDLMVDFKVLGNILPDFMKKKLGIEIGPARDLNDTSNLSAASKRLLGISNKSETDINIKVSAEPGTTASGDKVKRKSGNAKVNLTTIGYVGAGI